MYASCTPQQVDNLIKTVVYWGPADAAATEAAKAAGADVYSWDEFLQLGRTNAVEAGARG